MASHIRIEASTDGTVTKGDVYAALRGIDPTRLSKKSPVTSQIREAFVAVGEESIAVKVEGHGGEWSRSSQDALTHTLAGIDGVDSQSVGVVSGGFESEAEEPQYDQAADGAPVTDDEPEEADEEESTDVEEIDGVGPEYANTLRQAGIETVDDVIDGGADALVEAGISEGVAENIVESA